jgi:Mce-associated membrane protein
MADDAATPSGEVSESASEAEATAVEESFDAADSGEVTDSADIEDFDDSADGADGDVAAAAGMSHVRLATIVGLVVVVALAGLGGWLGFRAYESQKLEAQRQLFLQVGRQGAINLTTIDFEHAEADVQRILDSATGTFYDDFEQRAGPFVEVVKQAQSKSVGTVTEAGLETGSSASDTEAQVLVAVTVQTANAGATEQQPRLWRMRVTVQDVGDEQVKVSNVEFVP